MEHNPLDLIRLEHHQLEQPLLHFDSFDHNHDRLSHVKLCCGIHDRSYHSNDDHNLGELCCTEHDLHEFCTAELFFS